MTRGWRRMWAGVAVAAMLGGCHREQKATGHGTVSGEILPGSVSDAMLPYDSVKSKAPLAPVEAARQPDAAPSNNAADSAATDAVIPDSAAPDIAASPAPAAPAAAN